MALTRKYLLAMGIEEEKALEIIKAHSETVTAIQDELDGFKKEAEQLKQVKEELTETKKELKTLKDSDSTLKSEYDRVKEEKDKLEKEYTTYKDGITAQELHNKKATALKKLLKDAGVAEKHIPLIVKASKIDDYELNDEGQIRDSDKVKDNIKNEYSDYIEVRKEMGAKTATPPTNDGNAGTQSKAREIAQKYFENLHGANRKE